MLEAFLMRCRKFEFGPSCIIGATDFILRVPQRFRELSRSRCLRAASAAP